MSKKLYTAQAYIKNYKSYKNVRFNFFCTNREKPPINYKKAIDYSKVDMPETTEEGISEYFTKKETRKLRDYLMRKHREEINGDLIVEEVKLPITETLFSIFEFPFTNNEGIHLMYREDDYDLTFTVAAHYDLTNCEWDESVTLEREICHLKKKLNKAYTEIDDLGSSIHNALMDGSISNLRSADRRLDEFRNLCDCIPF